MSLPENLGRLSSALTSDASLNIGVGVTPSGSFKLEVGTTSKFTGVATFGSTLSNGTYTYTLPSATGTLALTSAIPANPVGGTGTTNYVPKFTAASTIGNSLIQDNGTDIGVNGSPTSISGYTSITINNTSNGSFLDLNNSGVNNLRFLCLSSIDQRIQAAGSLRFDTGGTARLTIASTGAATFSSSVTATSATFSGLITSTAASDILTATSSNTSYKWINLGNTGGNLVVGINTSAGGATMSTSAYASYIFTRNATDLVFGTNEVARLTIASTGAATFSSSVTATAFIPSGATVPTNGMYLSAANTLDFATNTTNRLTITSGGTVLVGSQVSDFGKLDITVTPSSYTAALGLGFRTNSGEGNSVGISFKTKISLSAVIWENARIAAITESITSSAYGSLAFYTMNATTLAERMRITSAGNVLIGATSTVGVSSATNLEVTGSRAQLVVNSTGATASWFTVYPAGDGNTYILRNTGYSYLFGTASDQTTTGFVQQMSISSNGSIGAPSGTNIYNASDKRLKQNIVGITDGLNKINALNPVKFNWIKDFEPTENEKDLLGFIAQEVQNVIPEAVEGFSKNSVKIGETVIENPLRVNEKFIIPVLVKAIQELKAEIDLLKGIAPIKPIDNLE
jgi:hypothetical protein